jgi:hypothetical protein
MKHLLWVVGVAAAIPAFIFGSKFFGGSGHRSDLMLCVVFGVIALGLFGIFFFIRFREEGSQDVSITKF